MRLYKVSMDGDFGDADGRSYWTARKSEIPALQRKLTEECSDPGAHPFPTVETVDVTPTKAGILAMLNTHATRGQAR